MTWLDFVVRLGTAFLLGSAIGLERQWRQRVAGLQTNTLVATGSALFVMLSVLIPGDSCPTRMAGQVVTGIGFLGGGVILKEGLSVRGLNTAATLWCTAAIGSLSGFGLLSEALIGAVTVSIANILLRPLKYLINQQPLIGTELELCYRYSLVCHSKDETRIRALLLQTVSNGPMRLRSLRSEDLETPERMEVEADLVTHERNDAFLEQIVSRLSLEPGVSSVSWKILEEQFG